MLLLSRGHKSCLCFLLQNVYYTSNQQLHVGVLSPTIDDDDNRCLVDVNSRPRLIECNYAKAKRMKLYWQFTQVILTQQTFQKVQKLYFCIWSVSNLFTNRTEPDLSLLSLHGGRKLCLHLIPMSATLGGYKTCVLFSEVTRNYLFLRQSDCYRIISIKKSKSYFGRVKCKVTYLGARNRKRFCYLVFSKWQLRKGDSGSLMITASSWATCAVPYLKRLMLLCVRERERKKRKWRLKNDFTVMTMLIGHWVQAWRPHVITDLEIQGRTIKKPQKLWG